MANGNDNIMSTESDHIKDMMRHEINRLQEIYM